MKIVILFVLSALTLGEMGAWRLREYAGCVLTFGGSAVYSWLKLKAKEEAAAQKRAQIELEAEAERPLRTEAELSGKADSSVGAPKV